jgi:hypothetical protein
MAEKPILFSGDMMWAANQGIKTQTRRVIRFPNDMVEWELHATTNGEAVIASNSNEFVMNRASDGKLAKSMQDRVLHCPYGRSGDLLVPRATWAVHKDFDHLKPTELEDIHWLWYDGEMSPYGKRVSKPVAAGKSRPGRFLPKTLWHHVPRFRNIGVKVERLQDITEEDARAEGCSEWIPCTGYTGMGVTIRDSFRESTYRE